MSTPAYGTVAWFEVATEDPEAAQRFYGGMFGWTFETDPNSAAAGMDYRLIGYPGEQGPRGGVFGTKGEFPAHAVFSVVVEDVEETCARAEELGGKTVFKVTGNAAGPDFAYIRDLSGTLFGVFSPAA